MFSFNFVVYKRKRFHRLMKKLFIIFLLLVCYASITDAATRRYRISFNGNPSTSVTIGWDQPTGTSPTVYFGTTDFGTAWASYPLNQTPQISNTSRGMNNQLCTITGLSPNTVYYFVIRDSEGTSNRFSFKTIPDDPTIRLNVAMGGDTRSVSTARRNGNLMMTKLRPQVIMFGGDYTDNDGNAQWQEWMDDWQLSIASDGRMFPLVNTLGNHEGGGDAVLTDLFGTPSMGAAHTYYYGLTFGGSLFRMYTLNSETTAGGAQETWLKNDLAATGNSVNWKFSQYHRCIRPHEAGKSNQDNMYNAWAQAFYDYDVRLVHESDAHVVKSTWPIRPFTGVGSEEGYIQETDPYKGSVYIGEGSWAPLRTAAGAHSWTRNMGSFNMIHWVFVDQCKVEIRYVETTNVASVGIVDDSNPFIPPANIQFWNPSNGSLITILNNCGAPSVSLLNPANGSYFSDLQTITLSASATDSDGSIEKVEFFVNNNLVGTSFGGPYDINWTPSVFGTYTIHAVAYDNDGNTASTVSSVISFGPTTGKVCGVVASGSDDAEERVSNGAMSLTSSDLELTADGANDQVVGIRYSNMTIPKGATITSAYIQFVCDETNSAAVSLRIRGHNVDNSPTFTTTAYNISSRVKTTSSVTWNPVAWPTAGQAADRQQTPDLSSIVQEIVDRPGWTSGNTISLLIDRLSGTGIRIAEAFEGDGAPAFCVEYVLNGIKGQSQISSSSDDAEQNIATGAMNLTSTDLELTTDGSINQVVGLRFNNISIPAGAYVTNAFIQFTTDDQAPFSGATSLTIFGQSVANASTFTSTANNISSRTQTSNSVDWTPPIWTAEGLAVQAQRTSDISSIINEIIELSGWSSGNSLAFMIEGLGGRAGWSYDGSPSKAPILVFTYVIDDALPLNIISFKGNVSENGNLLEWNTSQGKEVDKLVLQRSSNGYDFEDIFVSNSSNSSGIQTYEFLDKTSESYYYRLKVILENGSIEFSTILYIIGNKFIIADNIEDSFEYFPNPISNNAFLTIVIPVSDKDRTIHLRSFAGAIILERKILAGQNKIEMYLDNVSAGTYLIVNEKGKSAKLIVL